jgi:hypothetical protein
MKQTAFGACCAVALAAIVVSAQDKNVSMDKMGHMSTEKTYSGCLERSQAGSYALTHLAAADTMKEMKQDHAMKQDDAMKQDHAMATAEPMMTDGMMGHDAMNPPSLALSAPGKDLGKYVGRKVTVTGTDGDSMNGMATFTVRSVKTIARSCS